MLFSIEKLQRDVMARLGEIARPRPSGELPVIPAPADIICLKLESLLPEAGGNLINEASPELLGYGCRIDTDMSMRLMPCGMYAAEIPLPDDFLRLVSVKMKEWERNAIRPVMPGSAQWDCQWSAEPGIAGCPGRPRSYLDGNILRAIGSTKETDTLMYLRCWSIPNADDEGKFRFPTVLYPALVSEIAARLEVKS